MKTVYLANLNVALLTGIAVVGVAIAPCNGATVLQYQMGQPGPQVQDAVNGAAGGDLTAASGISLFNYTSTLTLNGSVVPVLTLGPINDSTNLSTALANQSWFTFNLTVGSGVGGS